MHSKESAESRIRELKKGKEVFMALSRNLAEKAQKRESITFQPKEKVDGTKAIITITNYLGGNYYFTSDEIRIDENKIYLIEAKHTKEDKIPSLGDIKDGLLKMILFTNLEEVKINDKNVNSIPILKLTTGNNFYIQKINKLQKQVLIYLKKEAQFNNFKILLNQNNLT